MSFDDISNHLNLTGASLKSCHVDANAHDAFFCGAKSLENCQVINLDPGVEVTLEGNCQNIRVVANGGTLHCAEGARLTNVDVSGGKMTLAAENGVVIEGLHCENAHLMDFRCGDNVRFADCSFNNAVVACSSHMGDNVSFDNCDFRGCHLNCNLGNATLNRSLFSAETRLEPDTLAGCHMTDLKFHDGAGNQHYVNDASALECCGAQAVGQCHLSPQAQLAQAGVRATENEPATTLALSSSSGIQLSLANISGGEDCKEAVCQHALTPQVPSSPEIARYS